MTGEGVRFAPLRRFRVAVHPHDPAEHEGIVETWESMQARLDAEWPALLERDGLQQVGPQTYDRQAPRYECEPFPRRLLRIAWTVPVDTPAHVVEWAALDLERHVRSGAVVYADTNAVPVDCWPSHDR